MSLTFLAEPLAFLEAHGYRGEFLILAGSTLVFARVYRPDGTVMTTDFPYLAADVQTGALPTERSPEDLHEHLLDLLRNCGAPIPSRAERRLVRDDESQP